ncbi:MAG: hypothetical protein ACRED5_05350 [Propylenella sp.]
MAAVHFTVHLEDAVPHSSLGRSGRAVQHKTARAKVLRPAENLAVDRTANRQDIALASLTAGYWVLKDGYRPKSPMRLKETSQRVAKELAVPSPSFEIAQHWRWNRLHFAQGHRMT